jgi:hypothetical protein
MSQHAERVIDLRTYFGETARLADLPAYLERAVSEAGKGNENRSCLARQGAALVVPFARYGGRADF